MYTSHKKTCRLKEVEWFGELWTAEREEKMTLTLCSLSEEIIPCQRRKKMAPFLRLQT